MTSRNKTFVTLVLFFSWLILSSVGLFYFGNQHYGQFDAKQNWSEQAAGFSLQQLGIAGQTGFQVVHVQQDNCICNNKAKQHIELFSTEYKVSAQAQWYLKPAQLTRAGFTLPATPAVLIFKEGKLIYAGPYATGPLCSKNNSIIAPLLTNTMTLPGLWLNGETKACRCLIKSE